MSQDFYQPLRPGQWSKLDYAAMLDLAFKTKSYTTFIFHYICAHAHPKTNSIYFKSSLIESLISLTGWSDRTIKRSLKTLIDQKFIKNLTPRKPHFLVNAEVMNKQKYLPYGFQKGLTLGESSYVVKSIMKNLPVYQASEADKFLEKLDDANLKIAQLEMDIEDERDAKKELIVWYDERIERLEKSQEDMKQMLRDALAQLTPEQKEKVPHLKLVTPEGP